ncbi:Crp/Fnr family transcriptional regulator [Nocardioides sp. Iso805N]|uniref:Crp/Fnr family transcriptional regulator n=1 Tax=Nocardioides sp. Iso805N TaxID=1283287 RepID=UPI0003769A69|nr:Crp/Fnr family transcriptional regulator [Nocardioides sp. Iso805N]
MRVTPGLLEAPRRVLFRGDTLATDSTARFLGIVETGILAIFRQDGTGREVAVDLVSAGRTIGEGALVDPSMPSNQALSIEAVALTRITWLDMLATRPIDQDELARAVLASTIARVRHREAVALVRRHQTLHQRIASQLLELWAMRIAGSDAPALTHMTRRDVARLAGTNRTTVSQAVSELAARGLISLDGASITGLDADAMRRLAFGRTNETLIDELHQRVLERDGKVGRLAATAASKTTTQLPLDGLWQAS